MTTKSAKKSGRHAGGAPAKYNPEVHPAWAASLASMGATNAGIAEGMGIACCTLYKWQSGHPEFAESLKAGKEAADARVEGSLYARAMGCEVAEVRVTENRDGTKTTVTTTRQLPPDVTACIFWLKNRQPALWRDRPDGGGQEAADAAIKAAIAACGLK